jgi:formylglycine-generating enzyme required for sulfatase activity
MDDQVRVRLKALLKEYGPSLALDAQRLRALLRDVCPDQERETFALVAAVHAQVPAALQRSASAAPGSYVRRLRELGLDAEVAQWTVETWALVLNVAVPGGHTPGGGRSPGVPGASGARPSPSAAPAAQAASRQPSGGQRSGPATAGSATFVALAPIVIPGDSTAAPIPETGSGPPGGTADDSGDSNPSLAPSFQNDRVLEWKRRRNQFLIVAMLIALLAIGLVLVAISRGSHRSASNRPQSAAEAPIAASPVRQMGAEDERCPAGQERSAESQRHCCWPGQSWDEKGAACRGSPSRCPTGEVAVAEGCGPLPAEANGGETAVAASAPPADRQQHEHPDLGFRRIPGGTFHLGCESRDSLCDPDEKPGREATVLPFRLMATDVTVAMYARCVAADHCKPPGTGGQCTWKSHGKSGYPINCVDWGQAQEFCHWAGGRLPTAVEWEHAAKGGDGRIYPWGNEPPDVTRAQFSSHELADVHAHASGASKQGLLDMAGNVRQWTATNYGENSFEVRGGSYEDGPRFLRSSGRAEAPATRFNYYIGFRCAQ